MPRNPGTGVYSKPSPDVITGTTIESTVYNTFVGDVETDLNAPRPIVAGGTGANNAAGARNNLDAEVARVQVANYDSQIWEAGSFWSNAGATAAPTGNICTGVCMQVATNPDHIVLEAIDNLTGVHYTRIKYAGVWGAWAVTGADKSGNLAVDGTLHGKNDVRSSGTIYGFPLKGTYFFGNTATNKYLQFDGASDFILAGGALSIKDGSLLANSVVISKAAVGGNAHYYFWDENNVPKGTVHWDRVASSINITNSSFPAAGFLLDFQGRTLLGNGFFGRAGTAGAVGSNAMNLNWTGTQLNAWVDSVNLGAITITSDYRIKKDVVDLSATWDVVKAMRPIKYTYADYTPQVEKERRLKEAVAAGKAGMDVPTAKPGHEVQPWMKADGIERWGFIAHELQNTLTPSVATGVKDDPNAVQSLNIDGVVAALTKALQEAMARIEALEAAQPP